LTAFWLWRNSNIEASEIFLEYVLHGFIGRTHEKSTGISSLLESVSLNSIRQILPDRAILEACRAAGYSFRHRCITPVVTVMHMLLSAIWPEESFNASWQVLWDTFHSHYPELDCRSPSPKPVNASRWRSGNICSPGFPIRPNGYPSRGPDGEAIGWSCWTAPVSRCRIRLRFMLRLELQPDSMAQPGILWPGWWPCRWPTR
jgi:hypothetical protein